MDKVSIIIPAYNAEAFVADSVNSALAQTHPNIEVIVVNDGSTDGTADRLREFGDRIRVHAQRNMGLPAARNAGVGVATGDWVAFLDADDLWMPRKLERQLADTSGAPMRYTDRLNFGARGDLPELQSLVTPMYEGDLFLTLLLEGNFITVSSVMLRRDVFNEMGGFSTDLRSVEDMELWLRIAEKYPISLCPEPLVSYRFHAGGMSRNYVVMGRERQRVTARALALARGRALDWRVQRQAWAQTFQTNGGEADRAGAKWPALVNYARAAAAWPLHSRPYKEAVKICFNV